MLPFTYAPVAEQILQRLKELETAGSAVGLGAVADSARNFLEKAKRFDAIASGKHDDDRARLLNRAMKRLSRLLVPLMSSAIGKYGHDPYGFTPQTTMVPALYDVPQLSRLGDGEQRWMLETRAVRDRNRVADTLADASAIIEDSLSRL